MTTSFSAKKQLWVFLLISCFIIFTFSGCSTQFATSEYTEQISVCTSAEETESYFEVHFLDVGQGDAALVLCDGGSMLIDGGNPEDSSLLYTYLKKNNITHLDYIVATHPHEDHIGGLSGALNFASVGNAYSPVIEASGKAFENLEKTLDKHGVSLTVPTAGDKFSLGSALVTILGPVNDSSDMNNISIMLRIEYGNTSFLFTGDSERDEEEDILNSRQELQSTILKVGHHGSENSTSYPFLREVSPEYAIISVGKDNSYGHPADAVLSRLRDADVTLYRTDIHGTVICKSDGTTVIFTTARCDDGDAFGSIGQNSIQNSFGELSEKSNAAERDYVLNISSKKFHFPDCSGISSMSSKNRKDITSTRDDILNMGYEPCGNCKP